jgi:adenylosuccinate synthase
MSTDIAVDMWKLRGGNVLLEGAQGALLDLDLGTYPYVSSGMSCAAGAASGAGIGPRKIDKVLGVFKAYSTRVGNGPMPSEFDETTQGGLCQFVRDTGREYGVTTGRPRRCGYLDLVALRYACRVNSIDELTLTHLDIYDTLDKIEACVAYTIDGKEVTDFPASIEALSKAKPVLKTFPGWKAPLKNCRAYDELPKNARDYVSFIEDYAGTPVGIVSVGYDRTDTIIRNAPWKQHANN